MFHCRLCDTSCFTVPEILKHCVVHDITKTGDYFRCLETDCVGLFSNFENLRKHLYQHVNVKKNTKNIPPKIQICNKNTVSQIEPSISGQKDSNSIAEVSAETYILPCSNITTNNAPLPPKKCDPPSLNNEFNILKLQEELALVAAKNISAMYAADPFITKKDVERCCNFTTSLMSSSIFKEIAKDIDNILKNADVSVHDREKINQYLKVLCNPLEKLTSEHINSIITL